MIVLWKVLVDRVLNYSGEWLANYVTDIFNEKLKGYLEGNNFCEIRGKILIFDTDTMKYSLEDSKSIYEKYGLESNITYISSIDGFKKTNAMDLAFSEYICVFFCLNTDFENVRNYSVLNSIYVFHEGLFITKGDILVQDYHFIKQYGHVNLVINAIVIDDRNASYDVLLILPIVDGKFSMAEYKIFGIDGFTFYDVFEEVSLNNIKEVCENLEYDEIKYISKQLVLLTEDKSIRRWLALNGG